MNPEPIFALSEPVFDPIPDVGSVSGYAIHKGGYGIRPYIFIFVQEIG